MSESSFSCSSGGEASTGAGERCPGSTMNQSTGQIHQGKEGRITSRLEDSKIGSRYPGAGQGSDGGGEFRSEF
ncbi:hypothetical protein AX14_001516 [Amanita brunnescens Koide BX004]|nr:hypothetical protein AX14_001516 [Amanita brunnescens Koide BX004]